MKMLVILSSLSLSACITTPALDTAQISKNGWGSQTAPQPAAPTVVYAGRFSASFTKEGKAQREQGRFEWKMIKKNNDSAALTPDATGTAQDTAMQIALLSPLGTTVALIAYAPKAIAAERASLSTPTNTYTAPTLDELMQNALGWRLPLLEMLPWLSPSTPAQSPPDWQFEVLSRHNSGLPKVVTASNTSQGIAVRLVFEDAETP